MTSKQITTDNSCVPLNQKVRPQNAKNLITSDNLFFLPLLLFIFLIWSFEGYGQQRNSALKKTGKPALKQDRKINKRPGLQLATTDTILLSASFPVLPVEISTSGRPAKEVRLDIMKIVSQKNMIAPVKYNIQPENADIYPQRTGKVYLINFDSTDLKSIDPGLYTIFISALPANNVPVTMKVHFELKASKTSLSFISRVFKKIKDDIINVVWTFIEIIFFIVIIGLLIWMIRLAFRGRNSLSVLSIINETGKSGEFEGIASGIDDILLTSLQDIREKSRFAQVKHYWLTESRVEEDRGEKGTSKALLSNVMSGGVPVDLHKLGDISIGPVKIPLGTIVAYITKLFGGNYVTGALQQYGSNNKIVLKLEKRPLFYKRTPDVRFFDVTWPSATIVMKDLAEGVPMAIEELAYRITLNITDDVGTNNWLAYKYFLDGIICYRDYEDNQTRKDRLIDSVTNWRESIRLDPYFAKGHYNLGVALDILKKYEDALFRYRKAIQLSEKLAGAEAHYNIAKLYWEIYKDDEKTLEELNVAKKLDASLSNIYNLEGLIYSKRKDYKKAVIRYHEAIKHCEKEVNPVFYYNLSVAYYNLKDFDAAKSAGENVLKLYGNKIENQPGVLQTMGLIYNHKGEYNKALKYFERGLQLEAENYDMLYGYGMALRELGQIDKAIVMHRRGIRLWPEYRNAYPEFAKTLLLSKKWLTEAEVYKKIGLALESEELINTLNHNDMELFLENCGKYLTDNKEDLEFQSVFAGVIGSILFYYFQKIERAIEYFKLAFPEKNADINYLTKPEYLHNYGLALAKHASKSPIENSTALYTLSSEKLQLATTLYVEDQVYSLAKSFAELAEVLLILYQFADADKAYVKSVGYFKELKLFGKASDMLVKDAKCLMDWAIGANNWGYYTFARDECNKAISINSTNYQAFHIKGLTYFDFRLYNEAIPQFEKATEINFNLPGAQYNLGLCYKNLGDYEMAASKFRAIIKLDETYADPDNNNKPDPYEQLFVCNQKLDNPNESENILRHATNVFPNSTKYSLLLGDVLVKKRLLDEAASIFEFAIDNDPENKHNLRHKSLNALADLYAEQGIAIEKAYEMSREALSICKSWVRNKTIANEELAMIRSTLGRIFYQKGQYHKAVLFLESCIVYQLDNPKPYAYLAMAYGKLASECTDEKKVAYDEKAIQLWDQVLKLDVHKIWEESARKQLQVLAE